MQFALRLYYPENYIRQPPLQWKKTAFNSKFIFGLRLVKFDFFLGEILVGSDIGTSPDDQSAPFKP